MMLNPYRVLANHIKGNIRYQALLERLCKSIFLAMQFGAGGQIESSGELQALQYIRKKLLQNPSNPIVVFDVGANTGQYTTSLLDIFQDEFLKILAFEPSPSSYQLLTQVLSKTSSQIEAYNFGFSDVETELTLFSEEKPGSSIASLYPSSLEIYWNIHNLRKEVIQLTTLDQFCREKDIHYIHLLKMDVEGHELKILEGARQLIHNNQIGYIQFEFGPCNIDSRTFFRDFYHLLNPTYQLYRIVRNGLFPIHKYVESYEIFSVVNYLAEHRDFLQSRSGFPNDA